MPRGPTHLHERDRIVGDVEAGTAGSRGARRSNAPGLPDEIYFSVVQRKVVTPNDFYDLVDVENRLMAFQDLYNAAADPSPGGIPPATSTAFWPASPSTNAPWT
jgi:hypothetical protein